MYVYKDRLVLNLTNLHSCSFAVFSSRAPRDMFQWLSSSFDQRDRPDNTGNLSTIRHSLLSMVWLHPSPLNLEFPLKIPSQMYFTRMIARAQHRFIFRGYHKLYRLLVGNLGTGTGMRN